MSTRPGASPGERIVPMSAALRHRGPDDHGDWDDDAAGVALAHRRLSVIDLSPRGRQPMVSADGRYVLTYNGEIYNFRALRAELPGVDWRGDTDTEVLVEAIAAWGPIAALQRCTGMFALALWDRREGVLHLARDRMGQKPLYYGWAGGDLVFGSELAALRAHPRFAGGVDRGVLALYLRYSYVPAPYAIHPGVYKLPPGTLLTLSAKDVEAGAAGLDPWQRPRAYWSVTEAARTGLAQPYADDDEAAAGAFEDTLTRAVDDRMMADVPLGGFLSAGVDSATVIALMQARSAAPVRTFTLGFTDARRDETAAARAIARHLGTDHTELTVGPQDALATVPEMPRVFDEPFADSSQIPTYLISKLARRHVTVALTGDGGDELFFGYRRYRRGLRIWRALRALPSPLKRSLAAALTAAGARSHTEHALRNLAGELRAETVPAMYRRRVSRWQDPAAAVPGAVEPACALTAGLGTPSGAGPAERMMLADMTSFLPDDVLAKVDRAGMAASLEARSPLMDHRVVELAWRLPLHHKLRGAETKYLLRRVLHRHLPAALTEQPKTGFGAPIRAWLSGPLRDWAEAQLDPRRLRDEGYFHVPTVRTLWRELLAGRGKWHNHIWIVLMFQAWLAEQRTG